MEIKDKKLLPPNDSSDIQRKRKTLKIMFLGYLIITLGLIIGIAFAAYKSFGIGIPKTPTLTSPVGFSSTPLNTPTPLPSETPMLLPSATFTLQPSITFTLAPYPMVYASPYPGPVENPYPILTTMPVSVAPVTITPGVTPAAMLTEAPMVAITETPQIPTASFNTVPSKTPTRIKHPCPCSHDIYDCKDFSTHALAQACYDYCILTGWGDAHHLDKGGTGIVCKGLP